MRIYKDLEMVEQLGSGIPRILAHYGKECFHFSENFLRMVFPAVEKVTEQVTEQVGKLIQVMNEGVHSGNELMEMLSLKHRPTFLYKYLQPAIDDGLVALTIPDKPRSSKQKYKLTEKGRSVVRSKINKMR